MTVYASADIRRGGTDAQGGQVVLSGVPVQIDNMSVEMGTYVVGNTRGATPFDAYEIYVNWASSPTMIQRSDYIIDPATPNPKNSDLPTQYLVVGNPEYFSDDGHMEIKAVRIFGT